jgi:hypothetical protein
VEYGAIQWEGAMRLERMVRRKEIPLDSSMLHTPPQVPSLTSICQLVLSFNLIQPEDGNCSACQTIGIASTYDMTEPRKPKLHVEHASSRRKNKMLDLY